MFSIAQDIKLLLYIKVEPYWNVNGDIIFFKNN